MSTDTNTPGDPRYTLAQLHGAYGAGWHAGRKAGKQKADSSVDVDWQKAMSRVAEAIDKRHEETGESLEFIAAAAAEAIEFGTRYYASEIILPLHSMIRYLQWGKGGELLTLGEFIARFEFDHPEGIHNADEPPRGPVAYAMLHIGALLRRESSVSRNDSEDSTKEWAASIGGTQ